MERIEFFKLAGPMGFCSNFSRHKVRYFGKVWMTSEHAYQAMKFLDPELQNRIHAQDTPRKAADIGRDKSLPMRPDWESPVTDPMPPAVERLKDLFMYQIVMAKFRQNLGIQKMLLDSGDAYLVEDTHGTGDAYWGETSPGVGVNRLGHILMAVRESIRKSREAMTELTQLSQEMGLYDLED